MATQALPPRLMPTLARRSLGVGWSPAAWVPGSTSLAASALGTLLRSEDPLLRRVVTSAATGASLLPLRSIALHGAFLTLRHPLYLCLARWQIYCEANPYNR
jgi:hypothetical protein